MTSLLALIDRGGADGQDVAGVGPAGDRVAAAAAATSRVKLLLIIEPKSFGVSSPRAADPGPISEGENRGRVVRGHPPGGGRGRAFGGKDRPDADSSRSSECVGVGVRIDRGMESVLSRQIARI